MTLLLPIQTMYMKTPFYFMLLFILMSGRGFSQSSLFSEIRKSISVQHPEIDFDEHLLAFSVWSIADTESRSLNKELEKTFMVYRQARLKGGKKGLIVVLYNKENLEPNAVIALQKDGVGHCYSLPLNAIPVDLLRRQDSGLFDHTGVALATDLTAETVYSLIQSLITR
jgi:hypothetical protein